MLTARFESLFSWLTRAFVRHDDAPRDVDHLAELAMARADLEDARQEIALERRLILAALEDRLKPVLRTDEEAAARASMLNITSQR